MSNANNARWVCNVCGYVHEGPEPPDECPQCGADKDQFEREEDEEASAGKASARWVCSVCGYVHEGPEPPNECPQCGANKDQFEREGQGEVATGEERPQATSARWLCTACGHMHEGTEAPDECPVCGNGQELFALQEPANAPDAAADDDLSGYLSKWKRDDDTFENRFSRIQELALTGKSDNSPMRTKRTFPDWEDVLFRGAQLARMPLNEDVPVTTKTVIGKNARHPMVLDMPFYVSHMSFGALSREAKIALARGSRLTGTAIGSGEGGLLDDERAEAGLYIYELGTASFSHRDDAIRRGDAVEIKIGQAAKPGLGGHLPKDKVTDEIARIRGLEPGQDSISPGRHHGIDSVADLRRRVDELRALTDGKPVGVKITAGHIEDDLACCLEAGPDFITIDCRGGATGSALTYVKDNVCLPPVFALHRARTFLDQAGSDVTLCVTGGFRDSTDIAKALAMGADAVALATASLIAIGCQQYRVCHTGKCPVGITTQNPDLRKRFDIEKSTERLVRFYTATTEELRVLARINGRDDVHALCVEDLLTLSREISEHTGISHA